MIWGGWDSPAQYRAGCWRKAPTEGAWAMLLSQTQLCRCVLSFCSLSSRWCPHTNLVPKREPLQFSNRYYNYASVSETTAVAFTVSLKVRGLLKGVSESLEQSSCMFGTTVWGWGRQSTSSLINFLHFISSLSYYSHWVPGWDPPPRPPAAAAAPRER